MRLILAALAVLATSAPALAEPVPVDMAAPVVHNDLLVGQVQALPVAPSVAAPSPSVVRVAADWIEANPGWCKLVALLLLILLGNGLARYPKAAGVLRYVHLGIDLLSPVVRADSPGTFKPPLLSYDAARGFVLSLSQPPQQSQAPSKPLASIGGAGLVLLFAGGLLSACASSPTDAARQALAAAERVSTQGVSALEQYDLIQQQAIVDAAVKACAGVADRTACIEEHGKAPIAAYRAKRAVVVKALVDESAVIGVGSSLIPLVESGVRKSTDLSQWLDQLFAAGLAVKDALHAFGVSLPGGL